MYLYMSIQFRKDDRCLGSLKSTTITIEDHGQAKKTIVWGVGGAPIHQGET